MAVNAPGDPDISKADGGCVPDERGVPEMVRISPAKRAVESGFLEFGRDEILQNVISSIMPAVN